MSSIPAAQPLGQTVTAAGWDPRRTRDVLLGVLAFAAGSIDVLSWLALGKGRVPGSGGIGWVSPRWGGMLCGDHLLGALGRWMCGCGAQFPA